MSARNSFPTRRAVLASSLGLLLASGAPFSIAAASAQANGAREIVTAKGVRFWHARETMHPFVVVQLSFLGGGLADPDNRAGVSFLAGGLLEEGAGELPAMAFQQKRDELGARIAYSTDGETLQVTVMAPVETLREALALTRLSLLEPRFDPEAIERVRGQSLAIVRFNAVNPGALAEQAFMARLFRDDAFGRDFRGAEEDLRAVSREDLLAIMPRLIDRDRMRAVVVGDIEAGKIDALMDETFGDWPRGGAWAVKPSAPAQDAHGVVATRSPSPQSVIVFGGEAPKRLDKDFMPAFVATHILAGSSQNSRLTREIRESRGLSYDVRAQLVVHERAVILMGDTSAANENTPEVLAILRRELKRMADDGPTEDELKAAKKYLTGSFALRFSSNSALATFLLSAQKSGLGLDYMSRRNAEIEAVTLEQARAAARKLFNPDLMLFSIAGDPPDLNIPAGKGEPDGTFPRTPSPKAPSTSNRPGHLLGP